MGELEARGAQNWKLGGHRGSSVSVVIKGMYRLELLFLGGKHIQLGHVLV